MSNTFKNLTQQTCSQCKSLKDLEEFYRDSSKSSGRKNRCKDCEKVKDRNRYLRDKPTILAKSRQYYQDNREHLKEFQRKYYSENKEECLKKSSEYSRKHRKENPEMYRMYYIRYRARKKNLPDTLTPEEVTDIVTKFKGRCAICEDTFKHLDHFIPISSGHGGTTKENIVPMCESCNKSKGPKNPFEWSKKLSLDDRERFNSLIKYLSGLNGIATVEDYEAHVYQCFK